ncbi:MAG: transglycosylase domain-containing protein [Bacteroidota bacterium]
MSISEIRANKKDTHRKIVRLLWGMVAAVLLGILAFFLILSTGDLPSLQELENPKSELATQIYGDKNEVFGRYYIENRVAVSYNELSPDLIKALVATEDERFYKHSGIDFRALGRVLVKTVLLSQESAGGASTLTQQLAKLLFTEKPASGLERVMQKFKEWIIALRLERRYTKEEIIAMYLNKFNFINGAYGIKAAAEIYFDKDQKDLTMEEAATLVGMLKNPSLYNPRRRLEQTQDRRNVVLGQMRKNSYLSEEEFATYKAIPLDVSNFKRTSQSDGTAPYFRAELAKKLKKMFERPEYRKPNGEKYDLYRDGLKVFTTIDPAMQTIAEEKTWKHMKSQQDKFWKHWKGKDPWTYKEEETTDREMEQREATLIRLVEGSDRYTSMRNQFLGVITAQLNADVEGGIRLWDTDIKRMKKQEDDPTYFKRMVRQGYFGQKFADKYREAMQSEYYPKLRDQWKKLKLRVKNVFKIPVKMTVFAYNDSMQKDTTMSPIDSIKYHSMFLQIGSMSVEPVTGEVKTWIGGINHKYFKYDHVQSDRQVGSTFKPFVYSTAIALQGFSPCFKVDDIPYTISPGEGNFDVTKAWTPGNSNEQFGKEPVTLRDALRRSINSITVYLMKQIRSVNPVIGMAHNMGIDSTARRGRSNYRIPRVPSIAIGAADLTVFEMTGAYNTFANNGTFIRPSIIKRIEDKNGRIIYTNMPEERQALNPRWNYVMLDMLKYVNASWRFNKISTENGGKTGTTNKHVDGWYMGVTPNLTVGTWVGGESPWIRFRTLDLGSGGKMARPFFIDFIDALEENEQIDWDKKARFKRPGGDLGVELNCEVYEQLAEEQDAFDEEGGSLFDDLFGDEELPIQKDTTVFEIDF